ncbi:hypothetical protein GJA_3301 [Janthinobacterium agaricidamnosum NBRC 102515 = DSM 9628]|uniref:Uncharacterized protein n=1 Tax=Janthinobacterium agaricidamnosum NBRC 102515 = DSM 9628 TaxID=1349767 RepID=W0V7S0_9BURK|nr:hypothetical protein GJA_3301 [Janthinobacterium agaricidamnosum NBRC 102515 = DSM 9628]
MFRPELSGDSIPAGYAGVTVIWAGHAHRRRHRLDDSSIVM